MTRIIAAIMAIIVVVGGVVVYSKHKKIAFSAVRY